MSTVELSTCDHGVVAKVKRCIMERDLYPKRWGLGNVALEKKKLKADGKLDKYGRPNEATPAKWNHEYTDFNGPAEGSAPAPVAQIEAAPTVAQIEAPATPAQAVSNGVEDSSKKRKRHEGETAEEKAERKRKKQEKKEKKAKKEGKKVEQSDDSE